MSKPVQKLITSRKMPLPPEQQRNPGAGAKAVQPQQPNAQKAHVGGKANKKGKMGITGLDKDAPEEDDDGESLDKLGTLHVHQGYDASTRKLLRGRVLQKQPTTYNQTGCIHVSKSAHLLFFFLVLRSARHPIYVRFQCVQTQCLPEVSFTRMVE